MAEKAIIERPIRAAIMAGLILICISLTVVFNVIYGVQAVYTQFFYVPILVASLWYHKKAMWLAAFLGALHLGVNYADLLTSFDPWARVSMFVVVGAFAGYVMSEKDNINRQLNNAKDKLHNIVDFNPDPTFVVDDRGTVIAWNRAIEEISGVPAKEMLGKGDLEYSIPFYGKKTPGLIDRIGMSEEEIGKRFPGTGCVNGKLEAVVTDARIVGNDAPVLSVVAGRLYDSQGKATGAIETIRDITHLTQLEGVLKAKYAELDRQNAMITGLYGQLKASEEKYREIAEVIDDGICIVDPDGLILYLNPRAEAITGYEREALLGRSFFELTGGRDRASLEELVNDHARGLKRVDHELAITTKPGRKISVELNVVTMPGPADKPANIMVTIHDITERRVADEERRKLIQAVEQSPATVVITDIRGDIEYVNPKFVRLTGYTAEEALGQNPRILKSGETRASVYQELWDTILAGREWKGVFHNRKKNGELYWEAVSISPVKDGDGAISHFVAVKEDITRQKEMEIELEGQLEETRQQNEQLHEQEKVLEERNSDMLKLLKRLQESEETLRRFELLSKYANDIILFVRPDGRILEANEAALKAYGYTKGEIESRSIWDIREADTVAEITDQMHKASTEGVIFETVHLRKDGSTFPVEVSSRGLEMGNDKILLSVIRDITERKRIEALRHESEARFSNVANSTLDAIITIDHNGQIVFWNNAAERMFGYTKEEIAGQYLGRLIPEENLGRFADKMAKYGVFDGSGSMNRIIQFSGKRKSGEIFEAEIAISSWTHDGMNMFSGVIRDITERKMAEEALSLSEKRFRTIFEDSATGIFLIAPDGRLLRANKAARAIFGYSEEELLRRTALDLTHPEDVEDSKAYYRDLMKGKINVYQTDKRYIRKDGRIIWGRLVISLVRDEHDRPLYFIAMSEDISARKAMEETLNYRNKELGLIGAITAMINGSTDIDDTIKRTLKGALDLLGMDAGAIYLEDNADPETLVLRAAICLKSDNCSAGCRERLARDRALDNPAVIYPADSATTPLAGVFDGCTATLIVPVLLKDRAIGFMAFHSASVVPASGSGGDELLNIGSQLGIAINNHALMDRLRETSDYALRVIDESPDAMIITDRAGAIHTTNKSASRLLGYPAGELRRSIIRDLMADGEEISLDEPRSVVRKFVRKDGSIVALNVSTAGFNSGETTGGFIITLKDLAEITGFKIVPASETSVDSEQVYHFDRGFIYLIERSKESEFMDVLADQVKHNIQGLCVTRQNPKKIRERYGLEKTPIVWLTGNENVPDENCIKPDNLPALSATLSKFIGEANDGLILLDGVEYLTTRTNYESLLKFMHFLNDRIMLSNCRILCCIDPKAYETRQYHLLVTEMREFDRTGQSVE